MSTNREKIKEKFGSAGKEMEMILFGSDVRNFFQEFNKRPNSWLYAMQWTEFEFNANSAKGEDDKAFETWKNLQQVSDKRFTIRLSTHVESQCSEPKSAINDLGDDSSVYSSGTTQ